MVSAPAWSTWAMVWPDASARKTSADVPAVSAEVRMSIPLQFVLRSNIAFRRVAAYLGGDGHAKAHGVFRADCA